MDVTGKLVKIEEIDKQDWDAIDAFKKSNN